MLGFNSHRRLRQIPARGWSADEHTVARDLFGEEIKTQGLSAIVSETSE
jgi:hypothetical protein